MPIGSVNSADNGDGARSRLSQRSTDNILQNTDGLRQQINKANSNVAAHKEFREIVGLGNYEETAQLYREQAAQAGQTIGLLSDFQIKEGSTLKDFKALTKKVAGYRPTNFKFEYGAMAKNSTLADFDKNENEYWKAQDEFMSINTDKLLTRDLENSYKGLIILEDKYRSLINSGDQIESFKVKGEIEMFKQQIDVLKVNRVNQIS